MLKHRESLSAATRALVMVSTLQSIGKAREVCTHLRLLRKEIRAAPLLLPAQAIQAVSAESATHNFSKCSSDAYQHPAGSSPSNVRLAALVFPGLQVQEEFLWALQSALGVELYPRLLPAVPNQLPCSCQQPFCAVAQQCLPLPPAR